MIIGSPPKDGDRTYFSAESTPVKTPKRKKPTQPSSQSGGSPHDTSIENSLLPPRGSKFQKLTQTMEDSLNVNASKQTSSGPTKPGPTPNRRLILPAPWYTVSNTVLAYCLNPSLPPPLDWDRQKEVWWGDNWNHLRDPPLELEPKHFLLRLFPVKYRIQRWGQS